MDDADEKDVVLLNYEMYKAEGDLHLQKGLLDKAVDNYTKVCEQVNSTIDSVTQHWFSGVSLSDNACTSCWICSDRQGWIGRTTDLLSITENPC